MDKVVLDSTEFSSVYEMHCILKEKMQFPEYYGNNLDALWDCLTGWINLPLTIEWIGYSDSKKKMGKDAVIILKTFEEAEREMDGFKIIID